MERDGDIVAGENNRLAMARHKLETFFKKSRSLTFPCFLPVREKVLKSRLAKLPTTRKIQEQHASKRIASIFTASQTEIVNP
jgi:hypothetical protein